MLNTPTDVAAAEGPYVVLWVTLARSLYEGEVIATSVDRGYPLAPLCCTEALLE